MNGFDRLNLSQRMGRALHWLEAPPDQRLRAIEAMDEVGDFGDAEDLPEEFQEMLKRASAMWVEIEAERSRQEEKSSDEKA